MLGRQMQRIDSKLLRAVVSFSLHDVIECVPPNFGPLLLLCLIYRLRICRETSSRCYTWFKFLHTFRMFSSDFTVSSNIPSILWLRLWNICGINIF